LEKISEKIPVLNHIDGIINKWKEYRPFVKLAEAVPANKTPVISVTGLSGSSMGFLVRALSEELCLPILIVTRKSDEASDLFDDISFLMGEKKVGHFLSRQILPFDFKAPVGETIGKRIATLSALLDNKLPVVVATTRSLIEPTITVDNLISHRVHLRRGDETDLDDLVKRLIELGFNRVPVVEEIGDFARRGGLIDFFSPGADAPVRVEFYGDEIETIREFDVSSQRTLKKIDEVTLLPKREIPITQQSVEKYLERLTDDDADFIRRRYLNDPELPGLEWLSVLFDIKPGNLLDYYNGEVIVILENEDALRTKAGQIIKDADNLYERLKKNFENPPLPEKYYFSPYAIYEKLKKFHKVNCLPFRGARQDIIDFSCQPHPSFGSRLDLLGQALREYDKNNISYFIATDTRGQAARLDELIAEKADLTLKPAISVADLKGGFVCTGGGFSILTDHEIFGRYHRRVRRKKFKEGIAISDYSSLNRGDYVVHTDYGIARYLGLKTIKVDGSNRDCLLLEYSDHDRLYVPIEEFNRVSKYSGKDTAPTLTQLGTPGWEKLKKKTKKAIADMAADLLKLYAKRKASGGFSFNEDTVWLKQLEASFIYEETPDQLKSVIDVKNDMENNQPMDRLICGDVGYGKTEVAVRAAFKAIENDKQVAVLVPTTILAQQHHQTFTERFAEFPVRVEMLSRFRTRKEQLQTIKDLSEGKVEMVIGTHRLLSKDVMFQDLGLLIVDEEHRFGVRHKEKLRQIKTDVDTISMTATPIPRTLQMSMMGVRDMSIINTSPKDRLPIITEIAEFDPAIISTTILRETERGGQVFFVHNRVQTIDAMYNYLKKLLPQIEIAIAHGQMHEKSLEGIMLAFLAKRYDVLLCTSIIESGLDIPSANTIIINRADRFGLAQLYQIRGRVGRSSRRAYAYLLTPPVRLLKADAVKRLRALEAHSDLGSGFALAMRDLEIRGAGTLLGSRQSGFIEEIGFDLYNKLLEEAVARLKGEEIQRLPETKLETDIEIHISENYISNQQQKVDIYRRLADCRNLDEVERIREEILDRFGKMPPSTVNLFEAAAVKISAAIVEIEKVRVYSGKVVLTFNESRNLSRREVESFRRATDCPLEFSFSGNTRVKIDLGVIKANDRLNYLRGLLGKI